MPEQPISSKRSEPKASRPQMPGYGLLDAESGKGLLPWSWAVERLSKAHNYFIATTRPDGRPHVMPVWGVWLDQAFYFSTGKQSRKAHNLADNPHCVICPENAEESVILEGLAVEVSDASLYKEFAEAYGAKYQWDMEGFAEPLYAVRPKVVFALIETGDQFTSTATRWTFFDDEG
jgi:nitroimidazol reductase NimA-like FMN-containing flavoprotein (pyridoxamine 5'-phosphate oxidase superfamily)